MPKCILIVDDSPAIRKALRHALEKVLGWKVCREAVDGLDAIEKAKLFQPDLIVIDLFYADHEWLAGIARVEADISFYPPNNVH